MTDVTTPSCAYTGRDTPRVLRHRHADDCTDPDTCRGCQPCTEPHCRIDGHRHAEGTCPECVASTRDDLREIGRLCGELPPEVEHRGINGEAMMLLAPAADPEAWGHREASAKVGRIDAEYLKDARDEQHPLFVLGTHEMVWRDHLDQPTALRATLPRLLDYLDGHLALMADEPLIPFEDFARDLRTCRAHLEAVLHEGTREDQTRVTCDNEACRRRPRLVRKVTDSGAADDWSCPACRMVYTPADIRRAHGRQLRHAGAEKYLPQGEAVATLVAQGRSERTIRKWLGPSTDPDAVVEGYCDIRSRKVFVWWPDLWRLHVATQVRRLRRSA